MTMVTIGSTDDYYLSSFMESDAIGHAIVALPFIRAVEMDDGAAGDARLT